MHDVFVLNKDGGLSVSLTIYMLWSFPMSLVVSCVRNLSLGKKLSAAVAIFLIPIVLMGYFLVSEKDDLISFTQQEVAGVSYLSAIQVAFSAVTSTDPAANAKQAIEALKKAEKNDAGTLNVAAKSQAAVDALEGLVAGKKTASDALAALGDLNSSVSDNSNITLDPDMDAYFVGDIIVNQSTGVLTQASALAGAASDLDADKTKSDDHKIAYAEARDGLATSAGNVATELGKAFKGNADGALQKALGDETKAVADAVAKVADAVKTDDRKALNTAIASTLSATDSLMTKSNAEMTRLLKVRIDGFHSVVFDRLGIAFVIVLFGGLISWLLVRSINKPLGFITRAMGQITGGNLDVEIPQQERADEIGELFVALRAFHTATVEREEAHTAEKKRLETDRVRGERIKELNTAFNDSVRVALSHLSTAVVQLNGTAHKMTKDSEDTSKKASSVAAAAEQASANVQTVASAAEQLSASIREIAGHIKTSSSVTQQAEQEAKQTRATVETLSTATNKIGEVVELINQIAGQTNLLALNATIEAARAGDAGKGFAVVASEVKTLANQTARATEDITNHISAIQGSVHNVIVAIEHIDGTISQINEIAGIIAHAVEQQREATQEISHNVQEAAQGTQEVTGNITQIAQQSSNAGRTAEDLLGAAKGLNEQAGKLSTDVDTYLGNIRALG